MTDIRQANAQEAELLTEIAARSEAYWGFDAEFMESFKHTYKVTEEMVQNQPTFVLEEAGMPIGFYNMVLEKDQVSLEYFYIDPIYIGKGFGRLLWIHMTDFCRNQGIHKIEFVTSPQAVDFYTRMGAQVLEEVDSLVIKNRKVPKLVYHIEN